MQIRLNEYKVKKGKHNFTPVKLSQFIPKRLADFVLIFSFSESCWYDTSGPIGKSWNKLGGRGKAFGANNKDAAMAAWRPSPIPNHFEVCGYTNDAEGKWKGTQPITIPAGKQGRCAVMFGTLPDGARIVNYELSAPSGEYRDEYHPFPYRGCSRDRGPWFGGLNPAPHAMNLHTRIL